MKTLEKSMKYFIFTQLVFAVKWRTFPALELRSKPTESINKLDQ